MKRVYLGIERLVSTQPKRIRGRKVGLLAHAASVDGGFRHTLDVLKDAGADVRRLFGPEHGFGAEAQDMEPVAAPRTGPKGIPLVSLYGSDEASLTPPSEALEDIEVLVIDLCDVGSRYYTFVWTAVLCLRACSRAGVEVIVADRPNPLSGHIVEGKAQAPGYLSFVGLLPIPNRHGMTIGEIATWAARREGLDGVLTVVPMEGWRRDMWYDDTGLPWVMPSPNMPTLDTATVYPGACLLEGTWASEGRGTTRPFELFGAPQIDPEKLARSLEAMGLPGARFRPTMFKPAFQKHAGKLCGGVQLHVTDRELFRPYETGVAALLALRGVAPETFAWRSEPYEFVSERPAVDLLTGGDEVRLGIEAGAKLPELAATWRSDRSFEEERREFLLYGR